MKLTKRKKIIMMGIGLFFLTIGVGAATVLYTANNVTYSSSSLSGNNVKDALDNLYNKCESSTTTCPSGMTCTNKTNIKCKRATTLHTETCSQTSYYCAGAGYSSGATITYGNQTITEGVLTTGDAFDCDVNGDGIYDAATERFYYLSDYYDTSTKIFNENVAVLIYYSNVRGGVASTQKTAYATQIDAQSLGTCADSNGCNWYGPITAKSQIPTTSQWNNIRLYKEERQILAQNNAASISGETLPTAFSYTGYAARFLTYQEVFNGCYVYGTTPNYAHGLDNQCIFLMETTKFSNNNIQTSGILLETPNSENKTTAFVISSNYDYLYNDNVVNTTSGARPAIEVLKSEILY